MKFLKSATILLFVILHIVLSGYRTFDNDNLSEINTKNQVDSDTIRIGNDYLALKEGKKLSIVNSQLNISFLHPKIIRLQDELGNCFSEGFTGISLQNSNILIEQQICSSKYYIKETVVFEMNFSIPSLLLKELVYEKTLKINPDSIIMPKEFNKKDFGSIPFSKVNLDSLYIVLNNPRIRN